jgi:hypothetical protein
MRGMGRWLAVAVVAAGTAGCSPGLMSSGVQLNPGCGAMQARAHHTTSQFTVRQKVGAIQARYSPSFRYTSASLGSSSSWKSLSSGECR